MRYCKVVFETPQFNLVLAHECGKPYYQGRNVYIYVSECRKFVYTMLICENLVFDKFTVKTNGETRWLCKIFQIVRFSKFSFQRPLVLARMIGWVEGTIYTDELGQYTQILAPPTTANNCATIRRFWKSCNLAWIWYMSVVNHITSQWKNAPKEH